MLVCGALFGAVAACGQAPEAPERVSQALERADQVCDVALPPDATPPATLSATGLYSDIANHLFAPYIRSYQPVYPLWSDGATKERHVYIPECARIDTHDMDHWSFPVGTRLWKDFIIDGARVETRYLHRFGPGPNDWVFATYQWDAAGADANLVTGGVQHANGTDLDIPPTSACKTCHGKLPERVLGFGALELSHDGPGETMASLSAEGLLTDPLPGGVHPPGDATAQAALGYLHANCGGCHNATGVSFLRMRLSASNTTVESTDTFTTAVGVPAFFDAPGRPLRIDPGHAETSLIPYRMSARGTKAQMPPLATKVVDDAGLAAVKAWIDSLPPAPR